MKVRRAGLVAVLLGGLAVVLGWGGSADAVNPMLASGSHGHLANGKALPHASGGVEVTFDDERAEGADFTYGSDDPPSGTASALGCANRGSATNARANQDCTARRQAEEDIAVNSADPTNVVAGQNDSRVGFNHCGFDYSFDGGANWGDGQPGFFQHLNPGTGHTYDAASDPALAVAGDGVAWYSCVVFDLNTNATGLFAVPSTAALKGAAYANIGAGASAYVVAEADDGKVFYDKEFLAADTRAGHHEVYVTFTRFLADGRCSAGGNPIGYCSSEIWYSKWDGTAWSAPVTMSGNAAFCVGGNTFDKKAAKDACNFNQGSMPVVLDDGSVFVTWSNGNTPTFVNQTLGRKINPDGSFGPVVRIGDDDESNVALCDLGRGPEECVAQLAVRTNDFPTIDNVGDRLVAVWQDSRHSAPGAGGYGVAVAESTDRGATWHQVTYLDPATGEAYFEPSVAISRTTGNVAVSFYRANPYGGTDGKGTYGFGVRVGTGSGFGSYIGLSDSQSNASPQLNPTQAGFLGDYTASAADPNGNIYFTWSDTRNVDSNQIPDEDVFVAMLTL